MGGFCFFQVDLENQFKASEQTQQTFRGSIEEMKAQIMAEQVSHLGNSLCEQFPFVEMFFQIIADLVRLQATSFACLVIRVLQEGLIVMIGMMIISKRINPASLYFHQI